MSTPSDGGPAFPVPPERLNPLPGGDVYWAYAQPGMTLRDYFAAAALQGMLGLYAPHDYTHRAFALAAYNYADAMLAERAKTKEAQS